MPKQLKSVVYDYRCDECGMEIMEYRFGSGEENLYEHICSECGYSVLLPHIYPRYENNSYKGVRDVK